MDGIIDMVDDNHAPLRKAAVTCVSCEHRKEDQVQPR
jgi:hypothetical protein